MRPANEGPCHEFDIDTSVTSTESPQSFLRANREALLARVQSELRGSNLVEELLAERRRAAAIEDAG